MTTALVLSAPRALASYEAAALDNEYFTIDERQSNLAPRDPQEDTRELSPLNVLPYERIVAFARSVALNLLHWTHHNQPPESPVMKYNRKLHFGRWINDPNDTTCFNTRAKVLIRDSASEVSFRDSNHCLVDKGQWFDPYTGQPVEESREIQIDHMVPLKNAYISGAWAWDFQTRCTYSNFMGNTFHLISASGHENMSKGDDTPESYLPPNEDYRCEYIANWLKIKLIWNLKMSRGEVEAIRKTIQDSACSSSAFTLSALELQQQRKLIHEDSYNCPSR